mgnify:FL=1|tara:strand:- start:41 stop:448 length:408 start_codon:yes stop_codon:yes gene_type:complete
MSWTFEKVKVDLLDNLNLNSHEKLLYILISRFKNVKNGINITNSYLMKRTGIQSKVTLRKYLDRLANFGLVARNQPNFKKPNRFTFDKNQMQEFININNGRRRKMSKIIRATKSQQKSYSHNINIGKVIPIKKKI